MSDTPKSSKSELHSGHRQRMKDKFRQAPSAMADHELLEILLYYSNPRRDTNEQAHELLRLGHSLSGVLTLTDDSISSINSIGDSTVTLIRLLQELFIRVEKQTLFEKDTRQITKANMHDRLKKAFFGLTEERMIMISTDKKCNFLNQHILSDGNEQTAAVSFKKMVKLALADNASYVFLAHNHPNEILAPSQEDLITTQHAIKALGLVDIPLIEHYIVTKNSVLGLIREAKLFNNK